MVVYHQTRQSRSSGLPTKLWPVLLDHYNAAPKVLLGIELYMYFHVSRDKQFSDKRYNVSGVKAVLESIKDSKSFVRNIQNTEIIEFLLSSPKCPIKPESFINRNLADSSTAKLISSIPQLVKLVNGIDVLFNKSVLENISISYRLMEQRDNYKVKLIRSDISVENIAEFGIYIVGNKCEKEDIRKILLRDMICSNTLFLYHEFFRSDVEELLGKAVANFNFYNEHNLLSKVKTLVNKTVRQEEIERKNMMFSKYESESITNLVQVIYEKR